MTLLRRCGLIPIDGPGRSTHYGWSRHQSDHRPCVRNIGAMGRLSCHTVAHVSHRQHFGSACSVDKVCAVTRHSWARRRNSSGL